MKLSYEAMAERVTPDEVIARLVDDMKKKAQITAHCGREKHADTGRRAFLDALETLDINVQQMKSGHYSGAPLPRPMAPRRSLPITASMCRAMTCGGLIGTRPRGFLTNT